LRSIGASRARRTSVTAASCHVANSPVELPRDGRIIVSRRDDHGESWSFVFEGKSVVLSLTGGETGVVSTSAGERNFG
jgi:hypothetical protein